jgi:hemolysin activation/secretion protein
MFPLGGYNTVRGYEEQLFVADDTLCANLEIHAPKISFLCKKRDELIFLAFMDYGYGHNLFPFEDERTNQSLWSVGTGMRYRINPYFSFRADYGFKLKSVQFDDSHVGKAHVGATLSY